MEKNKIDCIAKTSISKCLPNSNVDATFLKYLACPNLVEFVRLYDSKKDSDATNKCILSILPDFVKESCKKCEVTPINFKEFIVEKPKLANDTRMLALDEEYDVAGISDR